MPDLIRSYRKYIIDCIKYLLNTRTPLESPFFDFVLSWIRVFSILRSAGPVYRRPLISACRSKRKDCRSAWRHQLVRPNYPERYRAVRAPSAQRLYGDPGVLTAFLAATRTGTPLALATALLVLLHLHLFQFQFLTPLSFLPPARLLARVLYPYLKR